MIQEDAMSTTLSCLFACLFEGGYSTFLCRVLYVKKNSTGKTGNPEDGVEPTGGGGKS